MDSFTQYIKIVKVSGGYLIESSGGALDGAVANLTPSELSDIKEALRETGWRPSNQTGLVSSRGDVVEVWAKQHYAVWLHAN